MRSLGGQLQVLGIVVPSVDHEQIFQPPGDEQFPAPQEPEIPRPKETGSPVIQGRLEHVLRRLLLAPVAASHARSGNPDLPDLLVGELRASLGVGNHHRHPVARPPRTHQIPATRQVGMQGLSRMCRRSEPRAAVVDIRTRRAARFAARHHQRGLGEPVGREERLRPESGLAEDLGEPVECGGPHRLRPVEGHLPPSQIKAVEQLRRGVAQAELVAEIRRSAGVRLVLRDRRQPPLRPSDEAQRWEEGRGTPRINRLHDRADQPHVVEGGQPTEPELSAPCGNALGCVSHGTRNDLLIVEQVAMTHHHSARSTGGAGGVLEESKVLRTDPDITP